MSWFDEALRWYVVSLAAGLAFAPLTRWLFRRLPGDGAWFARPVGLLGVVWPVWSLSSITPLPFSDAALWVMLAIGAAGNWGYVVSRRQYDRGWLRSLITAEIVFLVAFAAFLVYKGFTPRITGTEKPMDVGFLAATMRATNMPPPDEWMAGETINYYYLGYLLNGVLARLTGLPSWIAFNLALASTFAMTLTASAGLASALAGRIVGRRLVWFAAVAGGFLVVIGGNLRTIVRLLEDPRGTWDAFYFAGPGWQASRVVVDHGWSLDGETINEFPSFSFVLGDLHPHVTALPFTIVALAIAVSFFLREKTEWDPRNWRAWAEIGLAGAIIGSLYPLNSWDFPTYIGAAAIGLLIGTGFTSAFVAQVILLGGAAILAWSPFWLTFVPFAGGDVSDVPNIPGVRFIAKNIAPYDGPWTDAGEYLTVFGMLWLIAVAYLAVETLDARTSDELTPDQSGSTRKWIVAAIVVYALVAIAMPAPVLLLAGIPLALALNLAIRRWDEGVPVAAILPSLYVVAFGATMATEFFYVRDVFNSRFNTLFKIYYQVWTILGVAGAVALVQLWQRFAARQALRYVMAAVIAVFFIAGVSYPIVGMHAWASVGQINPDGSWLGLDGLKQHGEDSGFDPPIEGGRSPDDVAAIRWLNDNAREGDVLLEAPGCQYRIGYELPTSRFSAFTGIPTIIGWDGAEDQWRGGQPDLDNGIPLRQEDVAAMYENPDPSTNPLFDQYGITLLIVGDLERYGTNECEIAGPYPAVEEDGYPGDGWTLVHESGETRIYRR